MVSPDANFSATSREARIRELAVMDWANMPSSYIREKFGNVSYQTITIYRNSDEYKQVVDEIRREWQETMLRLPHTTELKKRISHGMALSIDVLIEILVAKAPYKDKISAARLMSQLDGRFLHPIDGDTDESTRNKETESLAASLLKHIEKQRVM